MVCCNPEKIRDEICRKGGTFIKSIDIIPDIPEDSLKLDLSIKPNDIKNIVINIANISVYGSNLPKA